MNYELIVELLQEEVLSLRTKLQKSETTRAAWEADSNAARLELKTLTIERNQAEYDCEEIRNEIIQLRNHNNSLLVENDVLQSDYKELERQYKELQKENNELQLERASCETYCKELIEQRDEFLAGFAVGVNVFIFARQSKHTGGPDNGFVGYGRGFIGTAATNPIIPKPKTHNKIIYQDISGGVDFRAIR